MATMWLKDKEEKEPKRYMDKKAAKVFMERQKDKIMYLERQLLAAKSTIDKLSHDLQDAYGKEKTMWIVMFIIVVIAVVVSGLLRMV